MKSSSKRNVISLFNIAFSMLASTVSPVLRPTASITNAVKAPYYGTQINIRDFDAALGYIFSVCPLPENATPKMNYLPLLAIFCKFLSLMVFDEPGMEKPPSVACITVGAPPSNGGKKAIMFGTTIRNHDNKANLQEFRYNQLKMAYHVEGFEKHEPYEYGSCAETYTYICNIKTYVSVEDYILNLCIIVIASRRFLTRSRSTPYRFEGPVRGMAVKVSDVASIETFALSSFFDRYWKPPCGNCVELLTMGGYPPYDCFPHRKMVVVTSRSPSKPPPRSQIPLPVKAAKNIFRTSGNANPQLATISVPSSCSLQ